MSKYFGRLEEGYATPKWGVFYAADKIVDSWMNEGVIGRYCTVFFRLGRLQFTVVMRLYK